MLSTDAPVDLPHAPLGRASLTYRTFGDLRSWLMTERTGVLQSMHPVVSQALVDHSDLLESPVGRLLRSAAPVLGVVLDDDAVGTGPWVRDMHKGIKGKGYHALHPEVFYWTHATFFESQIAMRSAFGRPFSGDELEQLYAESVTWWRRYGMTDRVVPRDYSAFVDYWDHMVTDVLEHTPIVKMMGERPMRDVPSPLAGPVEWVWPVLGPTIIDSQDLVLRATMPEAALETLGLTYSAVDRVRFTALATAVRTAFAATPPSLRIHPWTRSSQTLRARAEAGTGSMELRMKP